MINPLPSNSRQSKGFDRLAKPVQRWIWQKGWNSLRDIQEYAIPALLDEQNDLIIATTTASGKTEAAFLPLISAVLEMPGSGGFDLAYIGPTKALINDQFERLNDLCANLQLPVYPWHGDISQGIKVRARKQSSGILLITPESLEALFVLRGLEISALFSSTRAIVIDELHALLENERGIHLRSLLTRLEIAVNRQIRRIGLSATLGEMELVREYLRPEAPDSVRLLKSSSDPRELRVQIRGYVERNIDSESESAAKKSVAEHLFAKLRGSNNLIFAESRRNVEFYADHLRQISEDARVPNEFHPHHASLSRSLRLDVEQRLKTTKSATAICTSTLELGIDIGEIVCVAQIGMPFSVASLCQRLGRSGRRLGQSAVLRMYAVEASTHSSSHPLDRLHLGLVRAIAMVELLIEGWCESPAPLSLHLSTLTHQILSVIAEKSGASAKQLFSILCKRGPFRQVDAKLFSQVLKHIGSKDVNLIEQAPDGSLLLGRKGENLVGHYNFYAVFQTPQEYRIVTNGQQLGTLPVFMMISEGMTIVFSGRRWRVVSINNESKVIDVTADHVGEPPKFGGNAGLVHDTVVNRMRMVLSGTHLPNYLDNCARTLLQESRSEFHGLGLASNSQIQLSESNVVLATWAGTVKTSTLAIALRSYGYRATVYDGFLDVTNIARMPDFIEDLETIGVSHGLDENALLDTQLSLVTEKYHPYLNRDLLLQDALSSRFDSNALPGVIGQLW